MADGRIDYLESATRSLEVAVERGQGLSEGSLRVAQIEALLAIAQRLDIIAANLAAGNA